MEFCVKSAPRGKSQTLIKRRAIVVCRLRKVKTVLHAHHASQGLSLPYPELVANHA
jgi:hypothetical protein